MKIDKVKFAAALARADMNCKRLVELSGVSRCTVSAIRAGKSCTEETARKLAAGLGVTVEELT